MKPKLGTELGNMFHIAKADAVSFLRSLPDESIDLIVTDPAYESLEKHRKVGTTTRLSNSAGSSNNWFPIFPNERFPELFAEYYRVLQRNRHFYMFCDQETMFLAKPIGERVGFKFWKALIWDKCLSPDTLVWTASGVRPIGEIGAGDVVAGENGYSTVSATRRVRSTTVRVRLSDATEVVCAPEHLFITSDGAEVEARTLKPGHGVRSSRVDPTERTHTVRSETLIPEHRRLLQLPSPSNCLWCGARFTTARAASAHQARHCEKARSKKGMARELGVNVKRLQRWFDCRMLPNDWVRKLGLCPVVTGRVRAVHQNDSTLTFDEEIPLDYDLGRLVGLYAAQGFAESTGIGFALSLGKRDSHAFIARYARGMGMRANFCKTSDNGCVVSVQFDFMRWLIGAFVGGAGADTKYFTRLIYDAPAIFRQGVFDGLMDGDGSFSFDEQRDTFVSTSPDLASFVLREARGRGWPATLRRYENETKGSWRVRFDRKARSGGFLVVESVEPGPTQELVDIAIPAPHRFVLANGAVTHNCRIGMGYHYRAQHEVILFFEKGKRRLHDLSVPDVLRAKRVDGGYPTEKPPELADMLISQSTDLNELVLDTFVGSGSTGLAAAISHRGFVGCDVESGAVTGARARIAEHGGSRQVSLAEMVTGQAPLFGGVA